jgi:hypothetical protein
MDGIVEWPPRLARFQLYLPKLSKFKPEEAVNTGGLLLELLMTMLLLPKADEV